MAGNTHFTGIGRLWWPCRGFQLHDVMHRKLWGAQDSPMKAHWQAACLSMYASRMGLSMTANSFRSGQ